MVMLLYPHLPNTRNLY